MTFDFSKLIEEGNYAKAIFINSLMGAIITAIVAVILYFFRKIFVTIKSSDSPFSPTVLKSLRISFIMIAVLVTFEAGLGMGLVVAGLFWCLYTIFDYGMILQTQYDETL